MSLMTGLARAARSVRNQTGPVAQSAAELTLMDANGWPINTTSETGAMKLMAVNRAMVLLSESVGKLPIYLVDQRTMERPNHHLLPLLNVRPNEAMSPSVERQMVEGNRLSGGNGYEWIIRDPRSGRPVELIPIPWELVTPWRDAKGLVWYGVVHPWTGEPMVLPAEDVCHYKAYSHDGLHGISVLRRAAEVISAGRSAQQYEASYWSNGGQPSGVLSADTDLNGTVKRKDKDGNEVEVTLRQVLRDEWERVHAGPNNGHRLAILDHGLKYQATAISNADAQLVESKAMTVEDIARAFGVPLNLLFAGKQAYNSNEQNSLDFVTHTLHPIVNQYDEERSYKLLTDSELYQGLWLSSNLMAELKGDSASRGAWYTAMRDAGALSVNDIRKLEDMPKVDGGDEYYASLNYVPLRQWAALSEKRAAGGGQ